MKRFLRFFFFLILFTLFVLGIFLFWKNKESLFSPCLPPLKYSLSTIDPQFGLTKEEVLKALREAEAVWEEPLGKDLFSYEEDAPFVINFIYDERQENTLHAQKLEELITSDTTEYNELVKALEKSKKEIEKLAQEYDALFVEYSKEVDHYNQAVYNWNQNENLSESALEELMLYQVELEKKHQKISLLGEHINTLATKTKKLTDSINEKAQNTNHFVDTYNTLSEKMPVFSKGTYQSQAIVIYQFSTREDLILTLAHELGHSLGIDHTEDPTSIMYPVFDEQSTQPIMATEIDIASLRQACKFKPLLP